MQNTKNITFTSLIAVVLLVFVTGCSEDWLVTTPSDRLSEAAFYSTTEHAIKAVTSAYDPLKHPRAFNQNFYFLFEGYSDRYIHESAEVNQMLMSSSNKFPVEIFTTLYQGVFRSNLAIEKIDGRKGNPGIVMDEALKTRLLAEVHFLRALYYFYISTIYKNPPLIIETIDDLDVKLKNSTREALFNQMKSDLEYAISNLPHSYDEANVGRATKGAAYALLGKLCLYFEKYDEAKVNLMKVKELEDQGVYGLITPQINDSINFCYAYQCNFASEDLIAGPTRYKSENNKESIFEIQFHIGGWEIWEGGWQADGQLTSLYFGPNGYKNLAPTPQYVEQFELAPETHPAGLKYDPRRYITFFEPGDTIYYVGNKQKAEPWDVSVHTNPNISRGFGCAKYFLPTFWDASSQYQNDKNNLRLIRYSDVLLMLCEAEYHLNGSSPLALECINKVRDRVGLNLLTEVTPAAIVHERDVEFGFELSRYWDLVRWSKLPTPWVNIQSILPAYNMQREGYLPLPISEINLSDNNLEQSPGY